MTDTEKREAQAVLNMFSKERQLMLSRAFYFRLKAEGLDLTNARVTQSVPTQ